MFFLQRVLQKSRASQSINQWISRSTALETADKRYQSSPTYRIKMLQPLETLFRHAAQSNPRMITAAVSRAYSLDTFTNRLVRRFLDFHVILAVFQSHLRRSGMGQGLTRLSLLGRESGLIPVLSLLHQLLVPFSMTRLMTMAVIGSQLNLLRRRPIAKMNLASPMLLFKN